MLGKRILIGTVLSLILLFVTACKESAIGHIVSYVEYGFTKPTLELFEEAEIIGVNEENLACINEKLLELNYIHIAGENVLIVGENIQTFINTVLDSNGCNAALLMGWSQASKILAGDPDNSDQFGYSVSIFGDSAIVGAFLDDEGAINAGAAYIFVRDNTGLWTQKQKLLASDPNSSDYFGRSVYIDGDTVIIGAFSDDEGALNSGAAYIFVRNNAGLWTEQQKLLASNPIAGDQFGFSVSINNDTAIIGAVYDDEGASNAGAAYIFIRNNVGLWTEQQKLLASDPDPSDNFSYSVSMNGDTVIIGALYDDEGALNAGAAYIFVRNNAGLWTEQQKLLASDPDSSDNFGISVSISNDTVIIGAHLDDEGSINAGSAYIFTRTTDVWTEQQKLLSSAPNNLDNFGISVSISDDTVIIGAYTDNEGASDAGSAYIFTRTTGIWTEQQKLLASDPNNSDLFGISVSIYSNIVIVGAYGDDEGSFDSGAAYIYQD